MNNNEITCGDCDCICEDCECYTCCCSDCESDFVFRSKDLPINFK